MQRLLTLLFLLLINCIAFSQINPENVTIIRDKWGVPHIYADTDAEAAYGIAWVTAEDDFQSMQENMLAIKGKLAEVKGKSGAIMDFIAYFLTVDELIEKEYETRFSTEFKKVIEGYVQGANAYAAKHPKEVLLKGVFPINEKDVIKGYMLGITFLTGVQGDVAKVFTNNIARYETKNTPKGSNMIAMNKNITSDGNTYVAINSHQPLTGPYAWYELHVSTKEGWNTLGANFAGGITPFLGTTPNFAWAHTVNHPDLSDVYKLEMNPNAKNQYKFDGEWLDLPYKQFKTKVKVGPFKFPFKRKVYYSKYGPTLKNKTGYYSFRFPAQMEIGAAEQWYKMNKATDIESFIEALQFQGLTGTNIIYGDRKGNIFYASNALLPKRNPKYDWKKVLPGNTSETLWERKFYPFNKLPQLMNPPSGYLFNTNNMPFDATAPADNLDSNRYDKTMGFLTTNNNRSIRFQKLISEYVKVSYDVFKEIKYDNHLHQPAYTNLIGDYEFFFNLDASKYPDLTAPIQILKEWDREATIDAEGASLYVLTLGYVFKELAKTTRDGDYIQITEPEMVAGLREAVQHLKKHFGSVKVPLGDLQRHRRGDVDLPIGGAPDFLNAIYSEFQKDGRIKPIAGESYIELVKFTKDGVEIESVNAYGTSAKEGSKHYTDQMELYTNQKLKKMTMNRRKIEKEAERIYHPK